MKIKTPLQQALHIALNLILPVFPCRPDKRPYTKNSLREQVESDALKVIKCTSSTLYKDFAFSLFKNNPFNPFNMIFLIIGFYTYFTRNDMRELICIARKLK